MPMTPDWKAVEEQLVETGLSALRRFTVEHADEICSFFAYAVDPYAAGYEVCLDIYTNGIRAAMQHERRTFGRRHEGAKRPQGWKQAHHWLDIPRIVDYTPSAGSFAFAGYASGEIEQWEAYLTEDEKHPHKEDENSYLEGNWRIAIWRAIEQLIKMQAFDGLRLSSPFRLGYELHDEELVVLRILNWPT